MDFVALCQIYGLLERQLMCDRSHEECKVCSHVNAEPSICNGHSDEDCPLFERYLCKYDSNYVCHVKPSNREDCNLKTVVICSMNYRKK
jgi:hypothetical protein